MEIKVVKDILDANERLAQRNQKLFDDSKVFAINLMSSPGAGKTSLILQTLKHLKEKTKIGVIEGDVSSSLAAARGYQATLY
jgi:hydrogenase nickel incorporation protein HypB